MSMLSRWTIGAMASKKARASWPVSAAIASASFEPVSGPGRDDRRMIGKGVDPLADDRDVAGGFRWRAVTSSAKASRSTARAEPAGNAVLVGGAHDQRAERAHLLVEKADGIVLGIVGPEAVGADHLGEAVGLVRRGHVPAAAHFGQANAQARFGQLPGGFGTGQSAADDVDVEGHRGVE